MSNRAFPGQPPTEMQNLRDRAERAEAVLRQRDIDTVRAEIAERKAQQEVHDQVLAHEAAQKAANELEEHRLCMWRNHYLEEAMAYPDGPAGFASPRDIALANHLLNPQPVPSSGWPPGSSPAEFLGVPTTPPEESEVFKDSLLGKAIAAAGGLPKI